MVVVAVLVGLILVVVAIALGWTMSTRGGPKGLIAGVQRSEPTALAAGPARPAPRHLIVDPQTSFKTLAVMLRRVGFIATTEESGEPLSASWQVPAERCPTGVLRYTHEPETGLRKLEIEAPEPAVRGIVSDIVTAACITTVDFTLPRYLEPGKTTKELLFGIRGAEWIGRGDDHRFYWEAVGLLRQHADPRVAAEACRVYEALLAEAGGNPLPKGPRGLALAWRKSGKGYVTTYLGSKWVWTPDGTLKIDGVAHEERFTDWPTRWTRE
ncbi:MAG TPA: hypothetical protein PLI95_02870 [Polyangiaceae bacterium]|mgnify:FL=1|nr:hypothetical protein [Polyangiaceae bacterium]